MSDTDQRELADLFCAEIDTYVDSLGKVDASVREKLVGRVNNLTIGTAVLPIAVTFISAYSYIITQQIVTFLLSVVDVVPPYLISNTKKKIEYYNKCSELKFTLVGLKGNINRLAAINQLKEPTLSEIKTEMTRLKDALKEIIKI